MSKGTILVTGAAGFIGSHTTLELLQADFDVVALDNFSNAIEDKNGGAASLERVSQITNKAITFVKCDLLDVPQLEETFKKYKFRAVIHLASLKAVAESVKKPLQYYTNNLVGVLNLIKACEAHNVKEFIFSSSATVYGSPEELPLKEHNRTGLGITNPYGQTKFMIEQILQDLHTADPSWKISLLRYFNPVGAHPSGQIGEDPREIPNNLMPFVAQVAIGKLPVLSIYGTKYNTPDGTGVRDYIHIVDLAKAHVAALEHLKENTGEVEIYNLGTGKGYSVRQMVSSFEEACGFKLNTVDTEPRAGDLAELYCDPALAREKLGWEAKFGIDEMCKDTWNWMKNNPNGYVNP